MIRVDVHKHAPTAAAGTRSVETLGDAAARRRVVECSGRSLAGERLRALEDRRRRDPRARQAMLAARRLVRRLADDGAAAVVRTTRRTPATRSRSPGQRCRSRCSMVQRAGEETLRELKLLVDHRDDLVAERRRAQQRLRWHCYTRPTRPCGTAVKLSAGPCGIDRVGRRARRCRADHRGADRRDPARCCRSLTCSITELYRELQARTQRARQVRSCPAADPDAASCSARSVPSADS